MKYLQMGTKFELVEKQFIQEKVLSGVNEGKHRDRFEILEKIGGGSFGVTYKVRLFLKNYKNTFLKFSNFFPGQVGKRKIFNFFPFFEEDFFSQIFLIFRVAI